jgi:SAM-dependent methyltransferase
MSPLTRTNQIVAQWCPPILLPGLKAAYRWTRGNAPAGTNPQRQDLGVYWDATMAEVLETWGEGNVWNEIQLIMAGRQGRTLDIACGTGKAMEMLVDNLDLELWGCDISNLLISHAVAKGLSPDRLYVGDATNLPYPDGHFEYSFSIGSIEHFTEEGIAAMLLECRRITRVMAFHTHPVSRDGRDHGWIKTVQSYFNNSVEWWLPKYRSAFANVKVLDSKWCDDRSIGKWFICS